VTFLAQAGASFGSWGDYWGSSWMIWLSAFCVLAIYSYVFKDNPVYRMIIQMFVGVSIGYAVIVLWNDILKPQWWLPMLDGFKVVFRGEPGSPWGVLWALVGVLGLLWYFQLSRKYIYLSRFVIGITVGIGAGLTFKSQIGQNMPQVVDSFRPLAPSVVAPKPVKRFALPSSVVPPVLASPVIYLADNSTVRCVEIMNGIEVWNAPLSAKPTRSLIVDGDDLVVPVAGADLRFDKKTGAAKASTANADGKVVAVLKAADRKIEVRTDGVLGMDTKPDFAGKTISSACVMVKLPDADGNERDVVFVVADGIPSALLAPSGKVLWSAKAGIDAESVHAGGRVLFTVKKGTVKTLDPNTGVLQANLSLKEEVDVPCIARMEQPTQDQLMAIVSVHGTGIAAAMSRADKATSRNPGEVLWRYETGKPILWTDSVDGVLFTAGPQGGACYEVPEAQKRLVPQDYTDNWVFVVALLSVMTYFFFSFKRASASKGVASFAKIGRWTLMIGFGAIFGNTIMTRMSFLLDRFMFLHDDWIMPFLHRFF
jgi:outer membrane protein assembly factor BamB